MSQSISLKQLSAKWITQESFQLYGQLITPSTDGKPYDESDAQLNLHNGIPRFYIMHLYKTGRKFHTITRHSQCTQCLGSLEGKDWLIAVAPPSETGKPAIEEIAVFSNSR